MYGNSSNILVIALDRADPAVDESGTGEVQNKAKIRAEEAEDLSKLPAFDSVFSSVGFAVFCGPST